MGQGQKLRYDCKLHQVHTHPIYLTIDVGQRNNFITGHISATQAYSLVPDLRTCLDCTSPFQPTVWWISWGSVFQTCTRPWSGSRPWCSGLGSWTHSGLSWTPWWHTREVQSCGNLRDWKVKSRKIDKLTIKHTQASQKAQEICDTCFYAKKPHSLSTSGVVDTGLLACADTSVHFCQHSRVHQLEEHELCLWVKGLLCGRVLLFLMQPLSLSGRRQHVQCHVFDKI